MPGAVAGSAKPHPPRNASHGSIARAEHECVRAEGTDTSGVPRQAHVAMNGRAGAGAINGVE